MELIAFPVAMAIQVDTLEVMVTNLVTVATKVVRKICTIRVDGNNLNLDLSITIPEP